MADRAKQFSAVITAVERYLPEHVLTNFDLERLVDTSDEWIRERTGIRQRRILKGQPTSFMAAEVARQIIERRRLDPAELDLIIVATITPDMFFPATACLVQHHIGASRAWGFDLSAACSGFVYAIVTGAQFIESGAHRKVLVIGADKMSAITDFSDRTTCVLFGDGAGGVLLERSEDGDAGLVDFLFQADGSGADFLYMKGGGSRHPASHDTVDQGMHFLCQDGRVVYKFAVIKMAEVSAELLARNGLAGDDLKLFVPHQANLRIIQAAAQRLKLPPEKVMINIDRYANTTAATIPIALSEACEQGRLTPGDLLMITGIGGGYTWGSALFKWAM